MKTVEVPVEIMEGLVLIMARVSTSFSGSETYPEARHAMKKALEFVNTYGESKNIDIHGAHFHVTSSNITDTDYEITDFGVMT